MVRRRGRLCQLAILGNLYKLADNDYANRHAFLVDGTPSVGDIYDSTGAAWKTILVAGLNKGGKAYYALDVTDPDAPKSPVGIDSEKFRFKL